MHAVAKDDGTIEWLGDSDALISKGSQLGNRSAGSAAGVLQR